jgi:hypothetical protein
MQAPRFRPPRRRHVRNPILFPPQCVTDGATLLLFPHHLELVIFETDYLKPCKDAILSDFPGLSVNHSLSTPSGDHHVGREHVPVDGNRTHMTTACQRS